ncbi:2-amino-4-hydroxy-6-hydroxymethyldihydropteridine diphosphokinase [Phaeovulum sp. W22_SRMD_FR3]|uniref:2-amino-4-hydroxy-6- hydroxymethyldihydropteridine diphosphokinase n=1 Tax=Phaeovulum sp. W22_SRMD_FR3 TaxID=3240274 RepID=UPI003F96B88C
MALGGNLPGSAGDCAEVLTQALAEIQANGFCVHAVSRYFRTPAFPPGSGPDFVNACASIRGTGTPAAFLALLHRIEADLGRVRQERWGARVIDLDLLAVGAQILPDLETQTRWQSLPVADQMRLAPDQLILPHPRLTERGFVLIPLADIAPDWVHPVTGETVAAMVLALPEGEKTAIRPLGQANGGASALVNPGAAP